MNELKVAFVKHDLPNDRNSCLRHNDFRSRLDAHVPDGLRRRSDEDDSGLLAEFGEFDVFRQKPVAWMNGLSPAQLCHLDDLVLAKVALED